MAYNSSTRIIDLTVGELLEAVEARVRQVMAGEETKETSGSPTPPQEAETTRYVYGLRGLQQLLGCSKSTASRLKNSGKLDDAITQVGSLLVIDADKALQLAGEKPEKKTTL